MFCQDILQWSNAVVPVVILEGLPHSRADQTASTRGSNKNKMHSNPSGIEVIHKSNKT